MTTIVIDVENKIIAADRLVTQTFNRNCTVVRKTTDKIHTRLISNQFLVGSGCVNEIQRQAEFFKKYGKLYTAVRSSCFLAIATVDNDIVTVDCYDYVPPKLYQLFGRFSRRTVTGQKSLITLGSGADFARAAMRCGKSAKEAVQVAAELDPFTGAYVDVVHLK